jgi:excisionase family DNA binding protein
MEAAKERLTALERDLMKYPAVLTPDQVADILGVSRRTADDYIKAGVIESFVLDPSRERKQYRVTKAALMAYMTNSNQ